MLKNKEVLQKLETLKGKELTNDNLHDTIFADTTFKNVRRKNKEKLHKYVTYNIQKTTDGILWAKIYINGNSTEFRVILSQQENKYIITEVI